jgi:hypothetical protein
MRSLFLWKKTRRRRRKVSAEEVEEMPRLPRSRKRKGMEEGVEDVVEEKGGLKAEGEGRTHPRTKVVAFGQEIPKAGLRNREF